MCNPKLQDPIAIDCAHRVVGFALHFARRDKPCNQPARAGSNRVKRKRRVFSAEIRTQIHHSSKREAADLIA
jgi:hypothetical protein